MHEEGGGRGGITPWRLPQCFGIEIQTVCYQEVWWTSQLSDHQCEWTQEWGYHLRQALEWSGVESLYVLFENVKHDS